MDESEKQAKVYLETLGLGTIAYEPDGHIPPDFAIGDIGIEVRRLNQNHEFDGGYKGLESDRVGLLRYVENLLTTFGPTNGDTGWWVFYYFWRPFDGKAVKRALPKALAAFKDAPHPDGTETKLTPSFELEIRPASIPLANYFMMGGFGDRDQGGFVASEIIRNLNLCIAEKAQKIEPHRDRYREWWLVLPDHIGPSLNHEERSTIAEHLNLLTFSRVLLIDPKAPTKALVVCAASTA